MPWPLVFPEIFKLTAPFTSTQFNFTCSRREAVIAFGLCGVFCFLSDPRREASNGILQPVRW
jgi:hypothetical protein